MKNYIVHRVNTDDKAPRKGLGAIVGEPEDKQEVIENVVPSVAESRLAKIVASGKDVFSEIAEKKALEIEAIRAEIAEIGKSQQTEKVKTEEVAFLRSCYELLEEFPDKKKWEQFWVKNILDYGGSRKNIENFFHNVSKSTLLRDTLRTENLHINGVLTQILMRKIFDKPEEIEDIVRNINERQKEIEKNKLEKYERIISNPFATDEEYQLGAYRESLESQVRDAVFELQKKGYLPMESGFNDLTTGSQYIGINKEVSVDAKSITGGINKNLKIGIKKLFSEISVQISEDRVQLVLVPKIMGMPLDVWRHAWGEVVSCIPALNDSMLGSKKSDNGAQGERFRDAQDKIRNGGNAWLNGETGLAFIDGKVVKMSYEDFINIGYSRT